MLPTLHDLETNFLDFRLSNHGFERGMPLFSIFRTEHYRSVRSNFRPAPPCVSIQINFFQDHTKVILCPLMGAVTYINEHREIRTYRLPALEQCGCSKQLFTRIKYAKSMIDRILAAKSNQNRLH